MNAFTLIAALRPRLASILSRGLVFALVLGAAPSGRSQAPEARLDLAGARLVLAPGMTGPERKAAQMLVEETQKRSQLAWPVTGSGLRLLSAMAESMRLVPTPAGCRLDLTQGLQARRGFGHVLGPMWRRNLPGIQQALSTLKAQVEAGQG